MKSIESNARSTYEDAPLSQEELALKGNVKGTGSLPEDLQTLLSENSVLFASLQTDIERTPSIQRIEKQGDFSVWKVKIEEGLFRGIPIKKLLRIPAVEISGAVKGKKTHSSHYPDWADLMYHPRISSDRQFNLLKRQSGARVIPHIVFGNDDRAVYYPHGYPWQCIGLVSSWNDPSTPSPQMSGSGALIGSNVVLTASHNVPWDADPSMMQFTPAYYDGGCIYGSNMTAYVEEVLGFEQDYPPQRQAYDMAVLKLTQSLGDWFGYFGARMYYNDWEDGAYWTLCGYPDAHAGGERPAYQTRIRVIDDDSDGDALEIEHRGDASNGNSGSPFFGWWDPGPYVIGTHSGGQIEKRMWPWGDERINLAAGGEALLDLVGWARDNW